MDCRPEIEGPICPGYCYTDSVNSHTEAVTQVSYVPSTLQQWIQSDQYLVNTKTGLTKMTKKSRHSLKRNTKKHKAYLSDTSSVSNKAACSNICITVQTRLRDMQDSWLSSKADEIKSFAGRKDMKKFFDALKTVYGPQSSGTTPLLSADGTSLLTVKEAILKRWAEHFDSVLNRPSSINDGAINRLPQVECNLLLDGFPTVSETVKAIKLLSSGKAPGLDAIPAEIYKAGRTSVAKKMIEFFHIIWRKEAIPQEFKDA